MTFLLKGYTDYSHERENPSSNCMEKKNLCEKFEKDWFEFKEANSGGHLLKITFTRMLSKICLSSFKRDHFTLWRALKPKTTFALLIIRSRLKKPLMLTQSLQDCEKKKATFTRLNQCKEAL
ncbi:hypothetical protein CDAR_229071 [Caerostris darwini]|uniref:Uncharacterized protein n=1 Tax=Caerostris darwini TaxID=1538125 RepID=A0AAV4RL85_9ARAC|nr:hypothetical protein CDAR_229011 [Caerostris darwini]GIY20793.1 hypothetical protein CDAR_229071 [Caerostris darwini]